MLTTVFHAVSLVSLAFCLIIMQPITERRQAMGFFGRELERQLALGREDVDRAVSTVVKDGVIPQPSQWGYQHSLNQFLGGLVLPGRIDVLQVHGKGNCRVLASASARPMEADFCAEPLAADRHKDFFWWRAKDGSLLYGQRLALEASNVMVLAAVRLDQDWLARLPQWPVYERLFRPVWDDALAPSSKHQASLPLAVTSEDLLRHGRLFSQEEVSFWLHPLVQASYYDPLAAVGLSALLCLLSLWLGRHRQLQAQRSDGRIIARFIGRCLALDKSMALPTGDGMARLEHLATSLETCVEGMRERLYTARDTETMLRQRLTALENDAIQMEEELKKEADAHHAFRLAREGLTPLHLALTRASTLACRLEDMFDERLLQPMRQQHLTLADWVEQMEAGQTRKLVRQFLDSTQEGAEPVFAKDVSGMHGAAAKAIRELLVVQDEMAILHLELSEALAKAKLVRDSLNLEACDQDYPLLTSIRFCERLMAVSLEKDITLTTEMDESIRLPETLIPRAALRLALYHAILSQMPNAPDQPVSVKLSHRLRGDKHALIISQHPRHSDSPSGFNDIALRHVEQVRHLLAPHGITMTTLPDGPGMAALVLAWKDNGAKLVYDKASTLNSKMSVSPARG